MEEIRGATWDLEGSKLKPWQMAQRFYRAGFTDARELAKVWATMQGESGGYLRAWHHNVLRDENKNIVRDSQNRMTVKSTDLGLIQRNVVHSKENGPIKLTNEEAYDFAQQLFEENPHLADGQKSADIAHELWLKRGLSPWYAYVNGHYEKHMLDACLAVGNFLAASYRLGGNAFEKKE